MDTSLKEYGNERLCWLSNTPVGVIRILKKLLHGVVVPPGDGMVVEVHLDIMDAPIEFLRKLRGMGFENDPFVEFFPPQYKLHYTGRARATKRHIRELLNNVDVLTRHLIHEARVVKTRMYVEIELVREIRRLGRLGNPCSVSGLSDFKFQEALLASSIRADVHVEFQTGTVSEEVREFLQNKLFYWVRTPKTQCFPSEEIATLQTSTFGDASKVFKRLLKYPLPACTGLHLEQKLAMIPTHPDLPMPRAVEVLTQPS